LVELFERVGLRTNTKKTVAMICVPGKIRTPLLREVYDHCRHGLVTLAEWKRRRVQCEHCEAYLSAASLPTHVENQHGIFRSKVLNRVLTEEEIVLPTTHVAYLSQPINRLFCPYPGCSGDLASEINLRRHFAVRHPADLVSTPRDRCPPKCDRCGLQVTLAQRMGGHEDTKQCAEGEAQRVQHEAAATSIKALGERFTAYNEELERVEVFKYLGRLLAFDDNDAQAIRANLMKARKVWSRVSRVLRAENASPRVCGMFYKATVQAVLLFGSETWNLSPSTMKCLEGFHLKAARRLTGMMPTRGDRGTWHYPSSEDVLAAAGLHTIKHYIDVRRQTIAAFIVNRPIFDLCQRGARKRGSSPRQFWWEQTFDLEEARASAIAEAIVVSDDKEEEELANP
jgi:hypothetical protein